MTKEKFHKLLDFYKGYLNKYVSKERNVNADPTNIWESFGHILWMIDEMKNMDDQEKANRWLGFIQGAFWAMGKFTIDEMRDHNRIE